VLLKKHFKISNQINVVNENFLAAVRCLFLICLVVFAQIEFDLYIFTIRFDSFRKKEVLVDFLN